MFFKISNRSKLSWDTFSEGQSNSRASLAEVPLPNGYEVKRTAQGQIYFLHSPTGVTTWHDPRVPKDLLQVINPSGERPLSEVLGPFPSGWEERSTRSNRSYFVDHAHRTTQFTDPRWDLKTFSLPQNQFIYYFFTLLKSSPKHQSCFGRKFDTLN